MVVPELDAPKSLTFPSTLMSTTTFLVHRGRFVNCPGVNVVFRGVSRRMNLICSRRFAAVPMAWLSFLAYMSLV